MLKLRDRFFLKLYRWASYSLTRRNIDPATGKPFFLRSELL